MFTRPLYDDDNPEEGGAASNMSKYPFSFDKCGDLLILEGSPHNYDMLLGSLGGYTPHLAACGSPPGPAAQMCDGQYQRTQALFSFIMNNEDGSQP